MYLVRLQGEKGKQTNKNPSMTQKQGGESFRFRQPPEEGMLFVCCFTERFFIKLQNWKVGCLKKQKKLRLYLGLIVPVDAQPI